MQKNKTALQTKLIYAKLELTIIQMAFCLLLFSNSFCFSDPLDKIETPVLREMTEMSNFLRIRNDTAASDSYMTAKIGKKYNSNRYLIGKNLYGFDDLSSEMPVFIEVYKKASNLFLNKYGFNKNRAIEQDSTIFYGARFKLQIIDELSKDSNVVRIKMQTKLRIPENTNPIKNRHE